MQYTDRFNTSMNLYSYLDRNAHYFSNKPYILYKGETYSFARVKEMTDRLAYGLINSGLQPGDSVALFVPNIPEFVIAYYAILRANLVCVPLNILYSPGEVQAALKSTNARGIVYWGNFEDRIDEIRSGVESLDFFLSIRGSKALGVDFHSFIEHNPRIENDYNPALDDDAVIMFTAGCTDLPRGVFLTHKNITSNAEACAHLAFLSNNDRFLAVLPFFYGFGHTTVMNLSMILGASLCILDKFDVDELLDEVIRKEVSVIIGVPSVYRKILHSSDNHDIDLSHVRICFSGGSPLPFSIFEQFQERFGIPILQGYGLTECSPVVSFNHSILHNKPGSVGTPISGMEMCLVSRAGKLLVNNQIGELLVRGEGVFRGYLNGQLNKEYFTEDGWFRTGDLFYSDDEGYYYYVGKKNNVIIKHGFEIYPEQIEGVLRQSPEIKEVAVVGEENPQSGQSILACIVPTNGATSREKIEEYIRSNLKPYTRPDRIEYLKNLPRSSTGKVIRTKLL